YWALVYMIPSSVFKDLDKLLKRFLWNAGDSAKGKARVAWSWVCKPNGLGLKPLKKWNEVMRITHVWKIIADKESFSSPLSNQIPKRDIFEAKFRGNETVKDGSFGEETDKITDLHQISRRYMQTVAGDGIASIKRRRRDQSSDDVRNMDTASGLADLKRI
ncbi:hypothetical protein Tco_0698365, partial [Tanacetum coccineum]